MNYLGSVGRLLSNFKGFYNEINSATLTGAIDIVAIQQEDGTYVSSPFHVRFGKMGVLRSREKIVDIEINGDPVDLHMKLGEAGEAFFVQEAEETGEVPAYLATSPLPNTLELMQSGIKELREQARTDSQTSEEAIREDGEKTPIDPRMIKDESNNSIYISVHDNLDRLAQPTAEPGMKTIASQTDITALAAEIPETSSETQQEQSSMLSEQSDSRESCKGFTPISEESHSEGSATIGTVTETDNFTIFGTLKPSTSSVTSTSPLSEGGKIGPLSVSSPVRPASLDSAFSPTSTTSSSHLTDTVITITPPAKDSNLPYDELDSTPGRRKRRKKYGKKKEMMKARIGSKLDGEAGDSNSSVEGGPPDDGVFAIEMSDGEDSETIISSVSRTISMPSMSGLSLVDEWASSQYASAFHPFSDGDITPVLSPIGSRPQSPKSDTELEYQHDDAMSQTVITGDAFQTLDNVKWKWGELPESEQKSDDRQKEEKPSTGGLFQFMRQTKKMRHKPHEEGIYLENINLDEMDPEVAALYLYHPKGSSANALHTIKDEDSESGRGASLPQSPVSMDREPHDMHSETVSRIEQGIPDIAMSLCGGLKDAEGGELSEEKFMMYLITHDQFVEDPGIMANPNLVVRIGNKYFTWAIAGPIVMSVLAFQRPLPDALKEKVEAVSGAELMTLLRKVRPAGESSDIVQLHENVQPSHSETFELRSRKPSFSRQLSGSKHRESRPRKSSLSRKPRASSKGSDDITKAENATEKQVHRLSVPKRTRVPSVSKPRKVSEKQPSHHIARTPDSSVTDHDITPEGDEGGDITRDITTSHLPKCDIMHAVEELIKQHMPKKERKRGWIWWRTTDETTTPITTEKKPSPPSSAPSSVPNSPQKMKDRRRARSLNDSTDDETERDKYDRETSHDDSSEIMPEKYKKSLKLFSEDIQKLNLKEGQNEITFSVTTAYQGTSRCSAFIYLWKWDDRIIVSDIDGTITKSDVLGQVLPMIGKDWSQAGIAQLYHLIVNNGYKFIYLSARAIGQSKITRDYLRSVRQGELSLPEGPLLLSPSSLISAFHREVIERKPEEFKISCLRDISALFPKTRNPFYAGYGNKINDVWAYRAVGIPISRIFTVNHRGELRLELSHTFMSSYTKLSDVVDHFFPPLVERKNNQGVRTPSGNFPVPDQFSTFTYWRDPLPDIEDEINNFGKEKSEKEAR